MRKLSIDRKIFNLIGYIVLIMFGLMCILPFYVVIINSFTTENNIIFNGYSLFPKEFGIEGYKLSLRNPEKMLRAYGVTTLVTVIGTVVGMFVMSMTAYVLQRKDFKYRNVVSFYLFFTTLFSGGLVPIYLLMTQYLHLKDTIIALILPTLLNVWYILILKAFMRSIPYEISESGKIDGAGDFRIFIQLILPLAKPALVSIGLFVALGYWNDWFATLLYISSPDLYSLQYYLHELINNATAVAEIAQKSGHSVETPPVGVMKMSLTVIVVGPIIFFYPFLQIYFVKGMTIGAVKG
jgi:putative aldouronate transport system permease protein